MWQRLRCSSRCPIVPCFTSWTNVDLHSFLPVRTTLHHTNTSNWRVALIYRPARGSRRPLQRQGLFEKCQGPTAPTPWGPLRSRNLWKLTGARIRSLKWRLARTFHPRFFCIRPSCVNVYPLLLHVIPAYRARNCRSIRVFLKCKKGAAVNGGLGPVHACG